MENLHEIRWQGWQRKSGLKGIRNKLLIVYTVKCSQYVAQQIADKVNKGDIDVIGFDGCYDNEFALRQILALMQHPNVGAVLAVGLGCEYLQPGVLALRAAESGKFTESFFIQEHGGTLPSIDYGVQLAISLIDRLEKLPSVDMGFEDLIVGAECGGSDYTSGLAGNALVGKFFDRLVKMGGTAIFEEIVEAVGLRSHLSQRAANEKARAEIEYTYDKAMQYCMNVRQYSVSPGNFVGGISSIEEKSMGAIVKSGTMPIQGVIKVSMTPPSKGLWLMDSTPDPHWMSFGYTNPNDSDGLLDLISAGAQLAFLITGRGNVIGSAVAPVYKITGNSDTYANMQGDMDFDAGVILSGKSTLDEACDALLMEILEICQGKKTRAELTGHKEYHIIYKHQNTKTTCVVN